MKSRTWEVLPIVLLLFLAGCVTKEVSKITKEAAITFVQDDLATRYPDAEIREIIDITESNGSWQIKARVTYNFSSKCPVRMHVYYDYPRKGFIVAPPEYITKDCEVCKSAMCVIGVPEEAIIASHTLPGSEMVKSYITIHPDAKPTAKFYDEYIKDGEEGEKYENVWIVKWFSEGTNYAVYSMIRDNGTVIDTWQKVEE